MACAALLLGAWPATAANLVRWHPSARRLDPNKVAALAIDGGTGKVLYGWNADATRHPASLTKLMTLYLLFGALRHGELSLSSELTFSAHAAGQEATNLHVRQGDHIRVANAIRAIIVHSANDVAVAIAERLGGTESHFAEMMTREARALGMRHTFYHNASGLPDRLQITTARDLGILARHVAYDYPEYYHFFATRSFRYHGRRYRTFDKLVGHYWGADGMKTGYTAASGFNLVTSVVRHGHHVIAVIMGGRTSRSRDRAMKRLLNAVYASAARHPDLIASVNVPWKYGTRRTVLALRKVPKPAARPGIVELLAENEPAPRPSAPLPALRPQLPGPTLASDSPTPMVEGDWTIQIGAFSNRATARAELAVYAEKSGSLLDDADPIVVPFRADTGQTLYRARFGSFRWREARRLCSRLMQRGQTCFAVAQD